MTHSFSVGYIFVLSSLCLFAAGCSKEQASSGPQPVPASGKITYNGSPLPNAMISLSQSTPGAPGAVGRSDKEGNFKLTAGQSGEGAIPGEYQISVSAFEETKTESKPDAPYDPTAKAPAPKSLVPQKFANPSTSGLKVTIPENGDTQIHIEVK